MAQTSADYAPPIALATAHAPEWRGDPARLCDDLPSLAAVAPAQWYADANCCGAGVDLFILERGGDPRPDREMRERCRRPASASTLRWPGRRSAPGAPTSSVQRRRRRRGAVQPGGR
jgi:hypothetical protein